MWQSFLLVHLLLFSFIFLFLSLLFATLYHVELFEAINQNYVVDGFFMAKKYFIRANLDTTTQTVEKCDVIEKKSNNLHFILDWNKNKVGNRRIFQVQWILSFWKIYSKLFNLSFASNTVLPSMKWNFSGYVWGLNLFNVSKY